MCSNASFGLMYCVSSFCLVFFIYVFECFFWIDVLCFKFLSSVLYLCVRMLLLDLDWCSLYCVSSFCLVFFIYVFECFFWIDVLCFKFLSSVLYLCVRMCSLFMCSNASFGLMYCVSSFCLVFFIYVFECFFWIDVLCFKFLSSVLFV